MENKYYTPDIEEFYEGFEYELFINEWSSGVFELNDAYASVIGKIYREEEMEYLLTKNNLRVKYLDREDIEDLGFVETTTKQFIINAPGKLPYWTEVVLDFRWKEDIVIMGKRGTEVGYLFRGYVKNKSELKKLLKQLLIIE